MLELVVGLIKKKTVYIVTTSIDVNANINKQSISYSLYKEEKKNKNRILPWH